METKDWYAETAAYLSACISGNPETAVILGSGLIKEILFVES